jgi:hypothetical protein
VTLHLAGRIVVLIAGAVFLGRMIWDIRSRR